MPPKFIGIVAHAGKDRAAELSRLLVKRFRECGVRPLLEHDTAALVGELEGYRVDELGRQCEMLVVLGGDGSLLRAVQDLGDAICPVFGLNLGSLGFLTCAQSHNWEEAAEVICNGAYELSYRAMLDIQVERGQQIVAQDRGLNDAVISRGNLSRLIRLDASIDGVELTRYNADGLIIATSTGSTAYSLSAGGPVILPESGVFVINPICPHVLTNRAVIVSDSSEIVVRPVEGQQGLALAVDGQEPVFIQEGDLIRIRKSGVQLPLVMLPDLNFCEVLRQKLKWSGSAV